MKIQVKPHILMPGQTLQAVIKQFNLYDVTKEELTQLILQYKQINTEEIRKPGERVMIPILERHLAVVFKNESV